MGDAAGVRWDGRLLSFRYPDPGRGLSGVRLDQHAGLPGDRLDFRYDDSGGVWRLDLVYPDARRLEYRFELRHPDGGIELVCDPDNPLRAGGAYGDRSVARAPGYAEPGWLGRPAAEGSWQELSIALPALASQLWARIWSPRVPTDLVLLAHDGPEYDKLAELGQYSAAMVAAGTVPAHHLVLLAPGARNDWYSANPAYARALAGTVLPRLRAELGTAGPVVGMGASLGGLAMLHAQRRYPGAFAGLFLQSASFFRPDLDPQESGFPWFRRIVGFTGRLATATGAPHPVPAVLTCGRVEENLANNREMAGVLGRLGYRVRLVEAPDAHNFTGWRDAFDPPLTGLLRTVWAPPAAGDG
jgi:enterochelin esterase-like enzyme